jgi:hypothetical protein
MIHREDLATEELCPELSEVMNTVSIEKQAFCRMMQGSGAQYQLLLFYCNSRWLSRQNVVARFYSLRGVTLFLELEYVVYAEHFPSEHLLSKLSHLSRCF